MYVCICEMINWCCLFRITPWTWLLRSNKEKEIENLILYRFTSQGIDLPRTFFCQFLRSQPDVPCAGYVLLYIQWLAYDEAAHLTILCIDIVFC